VADFNARIKPKRSTVSGEVPTGADLEVGEIALSTADAKLFTKHIDGTIKEISGTGGGGGGSVDEIEDIGNVDGRQQVRSDILSWDTRGAVDPTAQGGWYYDATNQVINLYKAAGDGTDIKSFVESMPTTGVLYFSSDNAAYSDIAYTSRVINGDVIRFGLVLPGGEPDVSVTQVWITFTNPYEAAESLDGDILLYDAAEGAWKPTENTLDKLTDVEPGTPTDGQVLTYETDKWVAKNQSSRIQDAPDFKLNNSSFQGVILDTRRTSGFCAADGEFSAIESNNPAVGDYFTYYGGGSDWTQFQKLEAGDPLIFRFDDNSTHATTFVNTALNGGTEWYMSVADDWPAIAATTTTLTVSSNKFDTVESETNDIPLAEGDILQWDVSEQAFRPLASDEIPHSIQTSSDFALAVDGEALPGLGTVEATGTWSTFMDAHSDTPGYEFPSVAGHWRLYYDPNDDEISGQFATTDDTGTVNVSDWENFSVVGLRVLFKAGGNTFGPFDVKAPDGFTTRGYGTSFAIDGDDWPEFLTEFPLAYSLGNPQRAPDDVPYELEIYIGYGSGDGGNDEAGVPLADGDILQWNNLRQKFVPAQLSNQGGGGAVDSVNEQTGAVSLGIPDMNDVDAAFVEDEQVLAWNEATQTWVPKTLNSQLSDDPYWNLTEALITGDGLQNGETVYPNLAEGASSTATGSGATTTLSKWGTSSIQTTSDLGPIIYNMGDKLGNADWTIEGWFYYDAADWSPYTKILSINGFADPFNTVRIENDNNSQTLAKLSISNGGSIVKDSSGVTALVANEWQHIAMVRQGSVFSMYFNGQRKLTMSSAVSIGSDSEQNQIVFGYNCKGVNDFRFTRGIARYTEATVQIPTKALTPPQSVEAVTSVNGETGVVSLGIQDMNDFELNPVEGVQYDFAWAPKGPDGEPAPGQWGTTQLRWNATDKDGTPYTTTGVTQFWVSSDGTTWYEETENIQFFSPYYYVATADIPTLHQRILDEDWDTLYLSFVDPATRAPGADQELLNGDVLAWNAVDEKFKPAQLPTRIQDQDDFELNAGEDTGNFIQFSGSQVQEEAIWTGGLGWADGDFYIAQGQSGSAPAFAWNVNDSRNDALQGLQVGDVVAFDFDNSQTYTVTEVGGVFEDERWFRFDADFPYAFGNPAQDQAGSLSNIKVESLRFPPVALGSTQLADGDILAWNASDQKFKPAQALSNTDISGLVAGQALVVNQAGTQWVNGPQLARWVVPGADPYADQVVFLADFDDSFDVNGISPTFAGTVTRATGKFGNAATFPGNAHMSYGDFPADLGDGDFTIDFWLKVDNNNRDHGLITRRNQVGAGSGTWGMIAGDTGQWTFQDLQNINTFVSTNTLTPGTWHFLAVTRSGNTISMWQDGLLDSTHTCSTNFNTNEHLRIGNWDTAGSRKMEGQMDDVRITVGVARYTSDFPVPTAPASQGGGGDAVPTAPLDILTDVDTSAAVDGYVLQYNEALEKWQAMPNIAGDGIARVQDATDWLQTDILEGQSMVWDGTNWVPGFPMLSQGDLGSGQSTTSTARQAGDLIGPEGAYADSAAAVADGWTIEGATGDDSAGKLAVPVPLQGLEFAGIPLLVTEINNGTNGNLHWDNSANNGNSGGRSGSFITDSVDHDFWLAHWSQDTAVTLSATRWDGTDWVIRAEYKIPYSGSYAVSVETTFSIDGTIKVVYGPNISTDGITATQGIASKGTALVNDFGAAANTTGDFTFTLLPIEAKGRRLNDLLDVNYTFGTGEDFVLLHDGTQWIGSPLGLNFLFDVDTDMNPTDGQQLKWNGTDFQWEAVDPLPRRVTGSARTTTIADNATQEIEIEDIGSAGMFLKVTADEDCWIRFYTSSAARTADTRASSNLSPSRGDGVLLEVIATKSEAYRVTPTVHYFQESPANGTIYMKVTNLSGEEKGYIDVQVEALMLEE